MGKRYHRRELPEHWAPRDPLLNYLLATDLVMVHPRRLRGRASWARAIRADSVHAAGPPTRCASCPWLEGTALLLRRARPPHPRTRLHSPREIASAGQAAAASSPWGSRAMMATKSSRFSSCSRATIAPCRSAATAISFAASTATTRTTTSSGPPKGRGRHASAAATTLVGAGVPVGGNSQGEARIRPAGAQHPHFARPRHPPTPHDPQARAKEIAWMNGCSGDLPAQVGRRKPRSAPRATSTCRS